MDTGRARHLTDERLRAMGQGPVDDYEWETLVSDLKDRVAYSPIPEDDFADEAITVLRTARKLGRTARSVRRGAKQGRSDPLAPPEWWEAESQRRLSLYREERILMRVDAGVCTLEPQQSGSWRDMFNLPAEEAEAGVGHYEGLSSAAEIRPLIERLSREHWDRYLALLPEPPWGWDNEDFIDCEDMMEIPAETWERDHEVERVPFVHAGMMAVRDKPPSLDRLYLRSRWLAAELGISQAECLVWGLTDLPFTIPWIPVVTEQHGWGDWTTVRVQANSLSAPVQAVAKAFTLARRVSGSRAPRPWPAIVSSFVEVRRQAEPDETWAERFAAFAAAHPEHPYKSVRTFRKAYFDYKGKEARA